MLLITVCITDAPSTWQEVDSLQQQISSEFESAFTESSRNQPTGHEWLASNWQGKCLPASWQA